MSKQPRPDKIKVAFMLDSAIIEWLDTATEEGKFSRSDVVEECLRVIREHARHGVFRTGKGAEKPLKESGGRLRVLVSVRADYLEWLDSVAEGAGVSRSEVLAEAVNRVQAVAGFLNKLGLTAIRRRRIAQLFGMESAPTNEERDSQKADRGRRPAKRLREN